MAFIDVLEHTAAWHAIRLKNIGGSDCPALFGEEEQPDPDAEEAKAGFSDSLFSLHYIKSGIVAPRVIEVERVDAGIFFEPTIASFSAARRGWKISKGRYATDDTTPGMGASLDYVIDDAGADAAGVAVDGNVLRGISGPLVGKGVLQIKNVDGIQFARKWTDGEPPLYIVLQVQHELACSGYKWGVLAAWVGGNSLRLYFYEPRPQIIAQIRQRVTEFWDRVAKKQPPAPDGSDASSYVLRELYPVLRDNEHTPIDLTGDNEVPVICAELKDVTKERLRLEKVEDECKAKLKAKMGTAQYAKCGSWTIKIGVTAANPGRLPKPGELIGKKSESRRITVKEIA